MKREVEILKITYDYVDGTTHDVSTLKRMPVTELEPFRASLTCSGIEEVYFVIKELPLK